MQNLSKINPLVRKALAKSNFRVKKITLDRGYYIVNIDTSSMEFDKMPSGVSENEWITFFDRYLKDAYGIVERVFVDNTSPGRDWTNPIIFIDGL